MSTHDPSSPVGRPDQVERSATVSRTRWLGGGTAGNEQLTSTVGVLLLVLLAVIGLTILRMHQLIFVHLFVGLALIGPVALKLGSTGYRFVRYYTSDRDYVAVGPPIPLLRLIAPMVVLSTIAVFASGVILLLVGPTDRGQLLLIHKVAFFVWLAFTGLHVLGHLPGLRGHLNAARRTRASLVDPDPGSSGRVAVVSGSLLGGVVLALLLLPQYTVWTAANAFLHHHH